MNFDFTQVSVPFHMRPGLARLAPDARHLTPLRPGSVLYAEKLAILRQSDTRQAMPGFDPADVLAAVRAQALKDGVTAGDADSLPLELQVEEDLVLLDTVTTRVPWMCVSVPSRWAPEEKIGLSLASIHHPVADGEALAAALPHLIRVLGHGARWERFVWTVSASPLFDQHPRRQALVPWPDEANPALLAACCFLRAERQTFFPLCDAHGQPRPQVVFTIRVMMEPLVTAVRIARDARTLHDSIASMSKAVLDYKGLSPVRDRLLRWLADRAAAQPQVPVDPV